MRFTDEEIRRYSRQMIVPEVGGIGQERLRAATATATSEIEALYLAAAGVGTVRVPSEALAESVRALNPLVTVVSDSPVANPAGADINDPPVANPGAAVDGALSAWRTIKRALEL